MASGGGLEDTTVDDGGIPLDIDNVHMLLQVEQEQIQKRTFTNWINTQLTKGSHRSMVSDLFSDLRDGALLLDLLEVVSGQSMKRERGQGVFQQRANIETALNFLKRRSVKLVNINIPDILDGRPSIILGLIWTIILHCHIEELASTLSFSSHHSSLDSLASLDSRSSSPALGSPAPGSPIPRGRASPLHTHFRVSAKKALLMWVRDQCQRVGCSLSVKDFKSSWCSGVAFLAILSSLRPDLVDLSRASTRTSLQNLEEAFRLAEQELRIPRLLEPEDVDVKDPDEKSIMTYVAQFLQYSNDCPAPDDDLQLLAAARPVCLSPVTLPSHFTPAIAVSPLHQASPNQRAREVTCWLNQAYQELLDGWTATERASYAERYQAFQGFACSFSEQRRPVVPLLGAMRRCPDPSEEQRELRSAWDRLEQKLQQCKTELDAYLPAPLDAVGVWLQHVEAVLMDEGADARDHAHAAREARAKQDKLKASVEEMSRHLNTLHMFRNADSESAVVIVPVEKLEEIKRRFTNARVTAKYHGIKLEYQEHRHTTLDLLGRINFKLGSWKGPYSSQEAVEQLQLDWHESVERQDLVSLLAEAFQRLKQTASIYTSKAALGEDAQLVGRQVKEAECETSACTEAVAAAKDAMVRVLAAWQAYHRCLPSLQAWLAQRAQSPTRTAAAEGRSQSVSEWSARQAHLNEVGNFLIEVSDPATSSALAEQLSKVNLQWADFVKRTMFEVRSQPSVCHLSAQAVQALVQEAGWLLREPLEVASVPLKAYRKRLQLLSKKIMEVDLASFSPSPDLPAENLEKLTHTLPEAWQMLAKVERTCWELQRAASLLEGRLAELSHWGTEATEGYQHLRETGRRGHAVLEPRAKALISRGLQLEGQVVTEGQDLRTLVTRARKSSSLQYLSESTMLDRVTEAVTQAQEIVEMLSSLGPRRGRESAGDQPPPKVIVRYHPQPEPQTQSSTVGVARSAHQSQGVLSSEVQPPTAPPTAPPTGSPTAPELLPQTPPQKLQGPGFNTTKDTTPQKSTVKIQTQPQARTPLAQTPVESQTPLLTQLQTFTASCAQPLPQSHNQHRQQALSQNQPLAQVAIEPQTQAHNSSPTPFKVAPENVTSSQTQSQSQAHPKQAAKFRVRSQVETLSPRQGGSQATPQPLVMVNSEVHTKAQAMAKSRLEKAKFRLQEHIQKAIVLFSDREISEWQAKRKRRALGILQPAVLEEFLGAVEGLGALSSRAELHDLELLSQSVRTQWEDVRSEMAAFLPLLWSEIRGDERPFNPVVIGCEMCTNTEKEALDPQPEYMCTQQACVPTEQGMEERVDAFQGLCKTLAPQRAAHTATAQPRELEARQETAQHLEQRHCETGASAPPLDSRGQDLGGHTPLGKTGTQTGPQQPSQDRPQWRTGCLHQPQPRRDRPSQAQSGQHRVQENPLQTEDDQWEAQDRALQTKDCPPKVQSDPELFQRSQQQDTPPPQAIVGGDSAETERTPERAVIQSATPSQEERPSEQEVLERYQASRLAFQSQLQRNRQRLEAESLPDPVTLSVLHNRLKELQALKLETEELWFEFELQYSQYSQFSAQQTEEGGGVEQERTSLVQQWRNQQICLQTRMASLDATVDLMDSADSQTALISEQLDRIVSEPADISGFVLADPRTAAVIKEMDQKIQSALRSVSGRGSEEEGEGLDPATPPPLCHALRSCGHRLNQLRQRLKRVQSAAGALEGLLSTLREADCGIAALRAPPEQGDGATRVRERRRSRLASVRQSLRNAGDDAQRVDGLLAAAGMTPTMAGDVVTCQDVLASLTRRLDEVVNKTAANGNGRKKEEGLSRKGTGQKQQEEELSLKGRGQEPDKETSQTWRGQEQVEEQSAQSGMEVDQGEELSAQGRKQGEESDAHKSGGQKQKEKPITQRLKQEEGPTVQRGRSQAQGEGFKAQRRRGQEKREGEEKRTLAQRRMALIRTLREVQGAVEGQGLQEPTLPAVQHRMRALADLESRLAAHRSELQGLDDASAHTTGPEVARNGGGATEELQTLWEETQQAVTERLHQCRGLTELLKRFQSVRSGLSNTLQSAERTIAEQASYMGKDNLQRLLAKVQATKADLGELGRGVDEIRGVCRQLQSQLRKFPDCADAPFESEADKLMDRWLDVTERTDAHLDNLRVGLALWDGLLQLGAELDSWTAHKMAAFAQSHPFQSEEEVTAMQEELRAQEDNLERFHRRASEIQVLLQSKEPPLELQVIGTQMRKKIDQVNEFFSETGEIYRQLVAAKGQVASKMAECQSSVQKIQDSLGGLAASDLSNLCTQVQELSARLQAQREQALGFMEELRLMASVTGPESLQDLAADCIRLQESVSTARQLLALKTEQAEGDIRRMDSLQKECDCLDQWLKAAELKAERGEELKNEVLERSEQAEALVDLVTSLHKSTLKESSLLQYAGRLLEHFHTLQTHILASKEDQRSLTADTQVFQTLAKDAKSWVTALQQQVDSIVNDGSATQSQAEQTLRMVQAVLSVVDKAESRLEDLRVAGLRLAQRRGFGEEEKRDVLQTISSTEEQWRSILQPAELHRSLLQSEPELPSCLARRQQARSKVQELRRQSAQLARRFPWPGATQRGQSAQEARVLLGRAQALGPSFSALRAQRAELARRTGDAIWEEPSWAALEDCQPALVGELDGLCASLEAGVGEDERCVQLVQDCCHILDSVQERMLGCQDQPAAPRERRAGVAAQEALLQEVRSLEKELVEMVSLKDSLLASCTDEGQTNLSQQVKDLDDHKEAIEGALESAIRDKLIELEEEKTQRDLQFREEVPSLQGALQGLSEQLASQLEILKGLIDIIQLEQSWDSLKDCERSLTELAARVQDLQIAWGSKVADEGLPADVILAVDAVAKSLDSLRSSLRKGQQGVADGAADGVRGTVRKLQQWSQDAQSQRKDHTQVTLNAGLQLQKTLQEALSRQDFLFSCLGKKRSKKLVKSISNALSNSEALLTSLSQMACGSEEVDSDNKISGITADKASLSTKGPLSAQPVETVNIKGIESPHTSGQDPGKCPERDAETQTQSTRVHTGAATDTCKRPAKKSTKRAKAKECDQDHISQNTRLKESSVTCVADGRSQIQTPTGDASNQTPITVTDVLATLPPKTKSVTVQHGDTIAEATSHHHTEPSHVDTTKFPQRVAAIVLEADFNQRLPSAPSEIDILSGNHGGCSVDPARDGEQFTDAMPSVTRRQRESPPKVVTIILDTDLDAVRVDKGVGQEVETDVPSSTNPGSEKCPSVTDTQHREESGGATNAFIIMLDMELPQSESQGIHTTQPSGGSGPDTFASQDSTSKLSYTKGDCTHTFTERSTAKKTMQLSESQSMNRKLTESKGVKLNASEMERAKSKGLVELKGNESKSLDASQFIESSQSRAPSLSKSTEATAPKPNTDASEGPKKRSSNIFKLSPPGVTCSELKSSPSSELGLAGSKSAELKQSSPDIGRAKTTDRTDTGRSQTTDETHRRHAASDQHQSDGSRAAEPSVPSRESAAPESRKGMREATSQEQLLDGSRAQRSTPVLASGLAVDVVGMEAAGGGIVPSDSPRHMSTVHEILSEIQGFVEGSDITKGAPWVEPTWYLAPSPREAEARLGRTVLRALGCRYQPAQLNPASMAQQLQEAEDCRRLVLEQVAAMNGASAKKTCDPEAMTSLEERWRADLLEASATVQVKEVQLRLVTQYHKQMQLIRDSLESRAAEMAEFSLDALGSSDLQAEKLCTLLLTMKQQKGMIRELLHLCGQVSAYLSEAEVSGTLLTHLRDLQDEWRLVEGTCHRALWHASISSSQTDNLLQEAKQLHIKLEALQMSSSLTQSFQSQRDSHRVLELTLKVVDLKAFNQQYLHLLGLSEDLAQFALGQKEKEEINRAFQGLKSLLDLTRSQLDMQSHNIVNPSLAKITKQIQDLVIWAKQAENHIMLGRRLALFPDEARTQITGMRKTQSEIVSMQFKVRSEIGDMEALTADLDRGDTDKVLILLKTVENLYKAIADGSARSLKEMENTLQGREKLLAQITKMDTWLAATRIERELSIDIENVSVAKFPELERKLKSHQSAMKDAERQLSFTDTFLEKTKEIAPGLSLAESRHLINRLMGLRLELDEMLAREKLTIWELEELLHVQRSSAEELDTVQKSLRQIAVDLERHKTFPVTKDTLSTADPMRRMLLEHQCHIQEHQHCQEAQRSALLCTIAELQEKIKYLDTHALEHGKYFSLRQHVEDTRDAVDGQIKVSEDKSVSVAERFMLCQALLVELPLVKAQCQEAADHLEGISQDLYPSQITSESQKIHQTVENLDSWELAVTSDIKSLEGKLLESLCFHTELPAMMSLLRQTRQMLVGAEPVDPDERAIDVQLQGCWVIWRNLESGMRMLEALGERERVDMKMFGELYTLRDAAMKECHTRMESLSQAREALKDYHWAAQGAAAFLHDAETAFLSPPGGFLDCTEERRHTQQALTSFEEGLQAHVSHLLELVPQSCCLSFPLTEQLHIRVLSHMLVGRATLEAQTQLRLEAVQRCADRQRLHRKCHEEVGQLLKSSEARLSLCAALEVTSDSMCAQQQNEAKALMEEVRGLAGRLEELKAGCSLQGCGVGSDGGALGALWRRWSSLRHGAGLLRAHSEQKREEWRDVTISIKQCSGVLGRLQADLPDGSAVSSAPGDPQELLAQAEEHQTRLEQGQRALTSLELRLSQLLGLSSPLEAASPVPVCQTLGKMQDSFRSLREKSMLVRTAALSEEEERRRWQEQMREVEQQVEALPSNLESHPSARQQQEVRLNLASQKAKLQHITEGVGTRYADVPSEISRRLQEVTLTLQEVEDKVKHALERSSPLQKLTSQIGEVGAGLDGVKTLLQQKSPTFAEAEHTLKRVWDELDAWHTRLTLLEGEVQDVAEEQPEQVHLLMDQLTRPLQLHQDTAQQAEQRTAFLSKIPACFQEYEDMLHSATSWLEEAQAWLNAPFTYTTAKSLQNHANTLQMVLSDSEQIRASLAGFGPSLQEISTVCDTAALEDRLVQTDRRVGAMQRSIAAPLDQLLHVTAEMDAVEAEVKTMEKNVTKIRAILSSLDASDISPEEHLRNRQVILANIQSMRRTVEEMESCKADLGLPRGSEETLAAFPRARQLLEPLRELEQLTQEQTAGLERKVKEESQAEGTNPSDVTTESSVLSDNMLESTSTQDPDEAPGEMTETVSTQSHQDSDIAKTQPHSVTEILDTSETHLKDVETECSSVTVCQVAENSLPSDNPSAPRHSGSIINDGMSGTKDTESVSNDTISVSIETRPEPKKTGLVAKETRPEHEKTGLVAKETRPEPEKTGLVAKETRPEHEKTGLVAKETRPEPEKTGLVANETRPEHEKTGLVAKETRPEHEKTGLVAKETRPEPEKTGLVAKETRPEPEKTGLVAKETKPEPEKTGLVAKETKPEPEKTGLVAKETRPESDKTGLLTIEIASVPGTSSVTKATGPTGTETLKATPYIPSTGVTHTIHTHTLASGAETQGSPVLLTTPVSMDLSKDTPRDSQEDHEEQAGLQEQRELVGITARYEAQRSLETSASTQNRLPDEEEGEEEEEEGRWARLHTCLSDKLGSLRNVQEEDLAAVILMDVVVERKDPRLTPEVIGVCFGAVLELQKCTTTLKQLRLRDRSVATEVSSEAGSAPGREKRLYTALCEAARSLDTITDLLVRPAGSTADHAQLRLLQLECISAEGAVLGDELRTVGSEVYLPMNALFANEPDVIKCLTCLEGCLQATQSALILAQNQLHTHLGCSGQAEPEEEESGLCVLEDMTLGQSNPFAHIKDVSSLECMLGSHWRKSPEKTTEIRGVSGALMQGLASLVELGQEHLAHSQASELRSQSQLQTLLCKHKRFFQAVGSQVAFGQRLFQHGPQGAPEGQEDEWVGLERRVRTLQQQALEQGVILHRKLQDWSQWEVGCGRVGRLLEELEALIPSEDPGEEESEDQLQERLHACQKVLGLLEESRPTMGWVLDRAAALRDAGCATQAGLPGGALELRWRGVRSRAQQEAQRSRDIQANWARFREDSVELTVWMGGANQCLETWSSLAETTPTGRGAKASHLTQLLDFSMKLEARSAQRSSALRAGTLLLKLKDADAPGLRRQLAQLEQSWAQVTSALPATHEKMQQLLLDSWPPAEVLSELEAWAGQLEARLEEEREGGLGACDAARLSDALRRYQELKVGVASGQLTLDSLCQSGPRAAVLDIGAHRAERTLLAERLGELNMRWLLLQGELESQVREAERLQHACADRETRLQRVRSWAELHSERLRAWQRPVSQTQAEKALAEWEAVEDRVKDAGVELGELDAVRVRWRDGDQEKEHPSDRAFRQQAEAVGQTYAALRQQVLDLKPTLQKVLDEWGHFEQKLGEVSLLATRVRCTLEYNRAPLLSPRQAAARLEQLQKLQEDAGKGAELWTAVDQSYLGLRKALSHGASRLLSERVEAERTRWKAAVQEAVEALRRTGELRARWQEYGRLSGDCSLRLQRHRQHWAALLSSLAGPRDGDTQEQIASIKNLQDVTEDLQCSMAAVLEASKTLIGQLEPLATALIQSETRLLSRDILLLSQALLGKLTQLQEEGEQRQVFRHSLEALEKQTEKSLRRPTTDVRDMDSVKVAVLELSNLLPALADLSEVGCSVTLNDVETERLRTLTGQWAEALASTAHRYGEIQAQVQSSQSFQQKCNSWKIFLDKMEEVLVADVAGSYSGLRDKLAVHQRLQVEATAGRQLLRGVVRDAVRTLEDEPPEKRSEVVLNASRLTERWKDSVGRARQRRMQVQGLLGRWRLYRRGLRVVWRLLRDVDPLLPPAGLPLCSLQQLRSSLEDFVNIEESLGRHSGVYSDTLAAGTQLCASMTEPHTQTQLQTELQALREAWEHTLGVLGKRRALVDAVIQNWGCCQTGLADSARTLEELQAKLRQPLPERLEDLEEEDELCQEKEASLELWAGGLRELAAMKTDLSQYVVAGDASLLQGQVDQLHCQWEELCQKVSLRRQEIADRLSAWNIFNDKNKELCDWLAQMENKVSCSGDLSIEEMVEKLKKDCMEEINLFSENKSHLKRLGEQLMSASDQAKRTQLHGSMQDASERWRRLFQHIEARVRKLKETLVTVQQLDKNMSNLRSWLSRIEAELSRPVSYSLVHRQEIQKRLAEQQELQRDIEQHTEGVASVLTLCDVLLRDEDACGGDAENDSIQKTSRSLDQRWRTICAMSLERRTRIEETWRLWCKFLDDYSRFEDWLKIAERTAANPNSAEVLYTIAKEELKKFEGFQRQVHERLTQLELVNNQYRRLARENRTDGASKLKAMVHEGNRRWDGLHRRVAAILRRLKHFTGQREEFEGTRESLLVWLTEMDLQLTNVEHFSQSDALHKMQQLNGFQKEITLNTERIDGLIVFGEGLIQRSAPPDAALIEDELEELHSYCQEVFSRVVRFHQRLTQPPTLAEESELFDSSLEGSSCEPVGRPRLGRSQASAPATPTTTHHLLVLPPERSGRETPASVDSLPLEWDHTGDVGGSSSHEDGEDGREEEGAYFSALSVPGRSMAIHESPGWSTSGVPDQRSPYLDADDDLDCPPTHASTPCKQGYARLMSECSGSIKSMKRVSLILDDEEPLEDQGLTGLAVADKQTGVIERWELLQAQSRSDQQQGPQGPQELTSDLSDITSWLGRVNPELERLQGPDTSASIQDMEARVTQLKNMQRDFAHYKAVMLSLNLGAQELDGRGGQEGGELQESLDIVNQGWTRAGAGLEGWESSLRHTLLRCQEFHETLHSLLLWLAHAESRRYTVDILHPDTAPSALLDHRSTLTGLQEELRCRQAQVASLQTLWAQLQPEEGGEESGEAKEKLHVTANKLRLLLRQVAQDLDALHRRSPDAAPSLCPAEGEVEAQAAAGHASAERPSERQPSETKRGQKRDPSPPRSFFYRVLRAAFPLHLLMVLLLALACLVPLSENDYSCTLSNNFARSFYLRLRYTNGPPPT